VVIAALAFGLLIGLAVGTLGGGGSVLAVPVLVYVLHQSVAEATTTSLVVVAAGALAGGLGHARVGRVCWRHAGSFTAAAVPGILAGTLAGDAVSDTLLMGTFSVILLAAAAMTWRKADKDDDDGWTPDGTACPPLRLPRDLIAGAGVGFLTGFFGVGGGFLIVPTLAIALAFTIRTAVGTSLAIITGTSLLGLVVHLGTGRTLDAGLTAAIAAACVAGALAGTVLSPRLPQQALGRAFAMLVTGVALYLVISVLALGGPPG
jgi:hypothetical protein